MPNATTKPDNALVRNAFQRPVIKAALRKLPRHPTIEVPPNLTVPVAVFADRVASDLFEQLPLTSAAAGTPTCIDDLIDPYLASLDFLNQRRQETHQFLRSVCEVSVEVQVADDDPGQQVALQLARQKANHLVQRANIQASSCRNILIAGMASLPLKELQQRLDTALERSLIETVAELVFGLERLSQIEVVGHIEWFPSNACAFDYFRQRVSRGPVEVQRWTETTMVMQNWERYRQTHELARRTVTIGHQTEWREHQLIHALEPLAGNAVVPIPRVVQNLVDKTPAWLRPFLAIASGRMINSQREITHSSEWTESTDELVRTKLKWIPPPPPPSPPPASKHIDPALTLGPFVLSAWTPEEVTAEERSTRRRESLEATQRTASRTSWVSLLGGFGCLCLAQNTTPIIGGIGMLLTGHFALTWVMSAWAERKLARG